MKSLIWLLLLVSLVGCHHQIQPQKLSNFDQQIEADRHLQTEFPAEALMADFAHRY